jgi:hypothetical protein
MDKRLILGITVMAGFCLGISCAQERHSVVDRLVSLLGSGIGIMLLLTIPLLAVANFNTKDWC